MLGQEDRNAIRDLRSPGVDVELDVVTLPLSEVSRKVSSHLK